MRKFLPSLEFRQPQIIEINYDSYRKLPYIEIPAIGKFMLDTGSSRSFISPQIADTLFESYKQQENFQVISTHATTSHNQVIVIPLFPIFKCASYHKFYVYSVDHKYDGLIGLDLLMRLQADISLKERLLKTSTTCIPIVCESYMIPLTARSEHRVRLPCNIVKGDAIIDFKEFHPGIRMPAAIVKCVDGLLTTVIQNTTDRNLTLCVTAPFEVTSLESDSCLLNYNSDSHNDFEIDEMLRHNLSKIRLDHMTSRERDAIQKLCMEYRDIFYCDQIPLSFTNQVKHQIRTVNEDPIYVKPYRQAPAQSAEIKKQVEKLLRDDVIQESHSPWSAPVHLVPKKLDASGETKYRMVIDYRRLNEITIDDKYPLPNITDLFDKLGKSTVFSTLDLASGYHQLEINQEDRQKTAFSTENGHYEFSRMPFGLKTAPATFQRAMDNVLRGLQGIHCLVYLDDILIYSSNLSDHIMKLRTVFDRLRQTNLKIQLDKSEFLRKEILYLGHAITNEGLKPNNDKIQTVIDYPIPKTQTEIKRFLGFLGYYRRFIKDFSKITQPMSACLKKGRKVVLDEKYVESFQKSKEQLINSPILQFPDMTKPFILTTDASDVAIGAVLSQGSIGSDRPIAYASRTLTDTEKRYSTIERELLAVIWAVKHFRPYLYGHKFDIYTDHKPLKWLYQLKEPNSKLARWRLYLQAYDFNIIHKSGKQNANADALSRIQIHALSGDDDDASMLVNYDRDQRETDQLLDDLTDIIAAQTPPKRRETDDSKTISISDSDKTISADNEIEFPIPSPTDSTTDTVHSARDMESTGIPILNEAIDTKPRQIIVFTWHRNSLNVKNISNKTQQILEVFLPLNNEDLIVQFLKEYIKNKTKYFIYFETEQLRKDFSNVIIRLFKKGEVLFFECTERVISIDDESEQKAITLKLHQGKTCHRGIKETLTRIKRYYYWPNMQETVSAILNACELCKQMKYDRNPIKPKLQLTQTQTAPFQEVFIDLFTIEGVYYLTLIDAFSKLGQSIVISNRSTPEVVRALIKYFSYYGTPKRISCDPGSEFNNDLLKELMGMYKIELHIGTPHNPNSMAIVERFHSTLIEIYRLARYEQKFTDAASVMTYAVMAYNHTIHSATKLTPFEVVFGHTDSSEPFNIDFERTYLQQLLKDHHKRTQFLYRHISDNLLSNKEKVLEKRNGEELPNPIEPSDIVFTKDINTRKSKDKPRFKKALVTGVPERNIVPIKVRDRPTKTHLKNVKRPPQMVRPSANLDSQLPGPSHRKD